MIDVRPGKGESISRKHPYPSTPSHTLSDVLEVLAHFIFDAALGVAAFVSGGSIAPSRRERMEQVLPLREFAKAKIEDASAMFIQKHNG